MSLVAHKYMPEQMSERELEGTFAAREHTLDYLVHAIRQQITSKKLTSFLLTGPRGSGKTTLVLMLELRLRHDPELCAAWLPVRFPEEAVGVTSLRDLLSRTLEILAEDGIPGASDHHAAVEAELDDVRSLDMAISALRDISQAQARRLVLCIENLDQVFARGLDEHAQATLRRLLMIKPFMLIVGTAVRFFEELQAYDEALFNFFCPVPLERLDDDQVRELMFRRARYDGNDCIYKTYEKDRAKIRAISKLTGGNPRFILMLYEVLSLGNIDSCVQTLRQLVDELTPLLKDVIEHQLTEQQSKIIDAIMRAGGVATPRAIATATRLPLNVVTVQLQRLKKVQMVAVRGGGKGKPAYYYVADQLFRIWYQMRFLRPHRRRIEMFVEVLRIWFEEEERWRTLRALTAKFETTNGKVAYHAVLAAEYVGASLSGTLYEPASRDFVVEAWLAIGETKEAAMALAEFNNRKGADRQSYDAAAYIDLGAWELDRGHLNSAQESFRSAVELNPSDVIAFGCYGDALAKSGNFVDAIGSYDRILNMQKLDNRLVISSALLNRGAAKGRQGDIEGSIADFSTIVDLDGAPVDQIAIALYNRGIAKGIQDDVEGSIADYSAVIGLKKAPVDQIVGALMNRGAVKGKQGNIEEALEDFSAVIDLDGAPADQIAWALVNRGLAKRKQGDVEGALEDYSVLIKGSVVDPKLRARVLVEAIHAALHLNDRTRMDRVLGFSRHALRQVNREEMSHFVSHSLHLLALPETKHEWLKVFEQFSEAPMNAPSELEIFRPIAAVLATDDRSHLDPLPPEQREFVEDVLAKFEPGEVDETDASNAF